MERQRLSLTTVLLLSIPPVLWAGNAIIGRLVRDAMPPMTLNLLRWSIALVILLVLGRAALRPGSGVLRNWRRYALLGLLGIGLYNSMQYLALTTSSPLNVTLVASGVPVWMLLVGRLFYNVPVKGRQIGGAVLSIAGVLVVMCRGSLAELAALRLVAGDLIMIVATIVWSFYSWSLLQKHDVPGLRADWAAFLLAQVAYGVLWSAALASGEWALSTPQIVWSWPLVGALLYLAIGPAIIAMRCWGAGVQRAGPGISAFFINLTPLFTALLSAAFLGELPQLYHVAAFGLIVGGIVVSAR
jgi:drug/metabolite transporter (DMT)-like permease